MDPDSLGSIQRHPMSHWKVRMNTCESKLPLLGIGFERKASAPPWIISGFNQNEKKNQIWKILEISSDRNLQNVYWGQEEDIV